MNLKTRRLELKITQPEIAHLLDVTVITICNIENNKAAVHGSKTKTAYDKLLTKLESENK